MPTPGEVFDTGYYWYKWLRKSPGGDAILRKMQAETDQPIGIAGDYGDEYVAFHNTDLNTWFERDRAHVILEDAETQESIIELWDDEVNEAIHPYGILSRDPSRWHQDLVKHVVELDMIPNEMWDRWLAKED